MEDLLTEKKIKVEKPKMYKVVLVNDDYTPMDFVVEVLVHIFNKDTNEASRLTMETHNKGRAIAGTYTHDVAETKVTQAHDFARMNGHPFMLNMEPEE
jgi:ATP-dependent Clp protease adaptor protein ClpS